MSYWIGAMLGALGVGLAIGANAHRSRVRAARAEAVRLGVPAEKPIAVDSIAALGEMVAPIILVALAWFTLKICVAFYLVDMSAYFSLFDLVGTLVLIGGYASWLLAKTRYRISDLSVAAKTAVTSAKTAQIVSFSLKTRRKDEEFSGGAFVPRSAASASNAQASMERPS